MNQHKPKPNPDAMLKLQKVNLEKIPAGANISKTLQLLKKQCLE